MKARSPYAGLARAKWRAKTLELIRRHPLQCKEIVEVVLGVWDDIFASAIGRKPLRIGRDLFPKPQIMAFLLHELISLELARRYPSKWRGEQAPGDKDLVYIPDGFYSAEIKASSHPSRIFGNRSYTQKSQSTKKGKSGYYLAVNFERFGVRNPDEPPRILAIRFGWLDASDWRGQKAASGQQASLAPEVEQAKLVGLFPELEV